ncbi:hypothetical protein D1AOALGA4SA_10199 [Olavius algarvensis Delta 1 endosymbiont]|nr:hypothetical protein D1AOALGA4SA_10199 [Olavius algarvensis Delta 1 endosymbiont]
MTNVECRMTNDGFASLSRFKYGQNTLIPKSAFQNLKLAF